MALGLAATVLATSIVIPVRAGTAAASTSPAAPPAVLNLSAVVHPEPPLSPLPNGDPFKADVSLLDQTVVDICLIQASGCPRVQLLSARTPSLTGQLHRLLWEYETIWTALGTQVGERYRVTFRVAGLNVDHVDMQAVGPLGLLGPHTFLAGTAVDIIFSIDNNPVVRARCLHDRGATATQVGSALKSEFNLSVDDTFAVLWNDVRGEDIDMAGTANAVSATASAAKGFRRRGILAPLLPPGPVPPTAFSLQQVIDSVTGPSYAVTAKQAAGLAKAQTTATNLEIVNALVNGANLSGLTSADLLAIIRDTLGVSSPDDLKLLTQATKNGKPAFSATDILNAIASLDGLPSLLDALKRLQVLGYGADPAFQAVKTVFGNKGTVLTAVKVANAALQVIGAGFLTPDIEAALTDPANFGVTDPHGLLVAEATNLTHSNCGAFKLPPTPGSIPAILAQRQDVLSDVGVGTALRTPTICGFSPLETASAVQGIYYSGQNQVIQTTKLAAVLVSPIPNVGAISASDLVTTLGTVLQNAPSRGTIDDTVACATALGARLGGGKKLDDIFPNLDGHPNLFGDPFAGAANGASGAGSPLDHLGRCLSGLGVTIPFPLLKVHIQYTHVDIPASSKVPGDTFVVGRVGWLPALPGVGIPSAANLGALNAVPALGGIRVPNLGGALASATMLPSFAVGNLNANAGCLWYNANPFGGCSTAVYTGFSIPGFDQNHVVPSPYLTLATALPGAPAPSVGEYTMVVPALPGALNMEASLLNNPNLSCATGRNPAAAAAATVAPYDIYRALPGSDNDFLSTGQLSFQLDGHSLLSGDFRIDESNFSPCLGATSNSSGLSFHIDVTPLGTTDAATNLAGTIAQKGQTAVTSTQGLVTAGGQVKDFRLNGVSALTSVDPAGLTGNLLSILAQQAIPGGVSGTALKSLLTSGIMP